MVLVNAPRRLSESDRSIDAQAGSLAEDEAESLSRYLSAAEDLVLSPGMISDPFSPGTNRDGRTVAGVRIGVMTDGEWVWDLAWADYVSCHHVAPPTDFLDHVRSRSYVPPKLDDDRIKEIMRSLGMPVD